MSFPNWYEELIKKNVVFEDLTTMKEPEKSFAEKHGVKSVLIAPVFVENKLWGYTGFDSYNFV